MYKPMRRHKPMMCKGYKGHQGSLEAYRAVHKNYNAWLLHVDAVIYRAKSGADADRAKRDLAKAFADTGLYRALVWAVDRLAAVLDRIERKMK